MPARRLARALAPVLAGLALLAPLAGRADEEAAQWRAGVDGVARTLMSRHHVPGMAVALTVQGRSWVFNHGVAAKASQAPVTDATLFEIGSVSKMFTTTLAALGQVTGHLALDDHPGRHLPRLRGRPIDKATLLHLGTYTAGGLPLQFPEGVNDDAAALDYLHGWQAVSEPGTVRQYANPSIGLLGLATAAAMKDRYANLIQARILKPLGMSRTYIHVPPQAVPDYAWGHRGGRQLRVAPGPLDDEAYGIKTTAADLLRFVQAQIDPRGLDTALRQAVQLTQVGRFRVGAGDMVQGFGWEQFPYPVSREQLLAGNSAAVIFEPQPVQPVPAQPADTPRLFGKTGSTGGFGAYVAFVPSRGIGLVMLANSNVPIAARIEAAHAILQQLAQHRR